MKFGQAISTCFAKYANFSGTATRPEYWYFQLFEVLVVVAGAIFALAAKTPFPIVLAVLGLLLPDLAVKCRRLRDGGFSPFLILLSLIPFGSIAVFIMLCLPTKRSNYISPIIGGTSNLGIGRFCTGCGTMLAPAQQFCSACGRQA
jgi:uncharacterized membrane protein YhaH (DUF805 family)